MKVCAACCIELPREKFSNKQWNMKQYQRRCIECIDAGRDCILLDKLHDNKLFKRPPQEEDCPICFLQLPSLETGKRYMSCCGKIICSGCIHAGATTGDDLLCPFCRSPPPILANNTYEEVIKRLNKRAEVGDAHAMFNLGSHYNEGRHGLPQDREKALELWHRAGELGNALAYYNIGQAYLYGRVVESNEKKAKHYWELSAMGGAVEARHNLGCSDGCAGNEERALKHFMIAMEGGDHDSVKMIQQMYKNGRATKDDYAEALKTYQAYLSEIKSDDRDKASAFDDKQYKYYE